MSSVLLASGAALKPYITQINKLSSEAAVVGVVPQILSDPNVYVFGELFHLDNIQQIASGDNKRTFDLLEIFAYGRYSDYLARADSLPRLSVKQVYKLRQLTVVSLSIENRVISYATLLRALDLSSMREMEELIIDALYRGILTGKLDSGTNQFSVESAIGRDVRPETYDDLLRVLLQWEKDSKDLVTAIESKMKYAAEEHDRISSEKESHAKKREEMKASMKLIMENGDMEGQGAAGLVMNLMGMGGMDMRGLGMLPGMHGMPGMPMHMMGLHDFDDRGGGKRQGKEKGKRPGHHMM